MSKILDRYASAVHSSNLKSKPETTFSDPDVLGAAGIASKPRLFSGDVGAPLAVALARLFSGDNRAAIQIIKLMAESVWQKAQAERRKLKRVQAEDMARAVLAWHRNGTCTDCGGHGYQIIPGTRSIGDVECPTCKGAGRLPFEPHFKGGDQVALARWLLGEVEREMAKAGPAAMAAIAPRLDF